MHEVGLKVSPPDARGGWRCYITNLIKEANVVKEQNQLGSKSKSEQARHWADVLTWELNQVRPQVIFCIGGNAALRVKTLQDEGYLPRFQAHLVRHYSARASDETVRSNMSQTIRSVLDQSLAV